ncbi:ricin-type beta-trefoil lectin protein [Kribbella voronezhensis]|uniref:Melibiase A n=1 Tax=Kribbella voronezhensis TaxID=2512212 RepID=A0A4R7SVV4_9ACTN|nr:ricin-type beta-trefoil lectin protein [Kribbella voronezhensis]
MDQQKSQVALWSMMASPLIVSSDAGKLLDQTTKDILGNAAIVAVDQDKLGVAATVVSRSASTDVLARPLANGDRAFALLNRTSSTQTLSTTLAKIGYTTAPACSYAVTDLWNGTTSTATGTSPISTTVAAYGTAIYRVSSPYGCGTVQPATRVSGPLNSKAGCVSVAATAGSTASPAPCDGTDAQRFTFIGDGTIRTGGNCLASTGSNGASVVAAACDATTSQQWSSTTTGNLKNAANNLCLDLYGGLTGTRFDTWPCGSSQANQVFQLPVSQATGAVHVFTTSAGQGTCLTTHGGGTASGTAVVSSACDGSDTQNWTLPGDGTVRLAGRCLDDSNSGGTGSNLILFDCTGNSNQQWSYALNGNLVTGLPSKLCAGVRGATTANDTAAELQTCGHNLPSQVWTLPT